MLRTIPMLLLGLLLTACPTTQDDDSAGDDDAGDDDAGDDDAGDDDTGPEGLLGRSGTATVSVSSYEGTEDLYFTKDYGEGEDICRIRYALSTVAVRDDCQDCAWAFDLVLGKPELIAETDPGCLATVGVDGTTLAGLEGTEVTYGYNPDYFGHIQVLLVYQGGEWISAGHAEWESTSGAFTYDWQDGYHPY